MNQEIIARLVCGTFDSIQHGWEVCTADFGHEETDGVRAPAGQDSCCLARDKLELLHCQTDAFCLFWLDRRRPVQNATDRGDRYVCTVSDICNGGGSGFEYH